MRTPHMTLRQRLKVLALLAYSSLVVLLGLPGEVLPEAVHVRTKAARELLDSYGINPWHFVFPGTRDHQKRRHIAVRFSGKTTAGETVVLHEGPEGLTHPQVRVWDSVKDTVSHKMLTMRYGGRLMRLRDDDDWNRAYEEFLYSGRPPRLGQAFCESSTLNGGRQMLWVNFDLFVAGIDYHTGEQYGRAIRVIRYICKTKKIYRLDSAPEERPSWPGVVWVSDP